MKRIHATVAFLAALLASCAAAGLAVNCAWAGQIKADQAKVDQAAANPAPADQAGTAPPAWRDKQIPDWTEADAKQLLADSPWAKSVTPTSDKPLEKKPSQSSTRKRFGMGGLGIGRRSSSGSAPAPDGNSSSSSGSSSTSKDAPLPTLRIRWESALPVREAELKSRDTGALAVDQDRYAIAVYGIPSDLVKDDSKKFAEQLKAQAAIKRNAKEDIKPSSIVIRMRADGPVILYLFPRTEEITWRDHEIEFNAQIGQLKIKQSFESDDMRFHGTLEL